MTTPRSAFQFFPTMGEIDIHKNKILGFFSFQKTSATLKFKELHRNHLLNQTLKLLISEAGFPPFILELHRITAEVVDLVWL